MYQKFKKLRRDVYAHYKKHGRHTLPWRKTTDPYRILVSEIMLQQTQVDRVLPYYRTFLKTFPTVHMLAQAPLSTVVRLWQGLGYNRRALFLHKAAKIIVDRFDGRVPCLREDLESLPGVGEYTAAAIQAFAFDMPAIVLETNVRSAIIRLFFAGRHRVSEEQVKNIMRRYSEKSPRVWYWALMDYGAYTKKQYGNANRASMVYVKQKSFRGSLREVRGAIVRVLTKHSATEKTLMAAMEQRMKPRAGEAVRTLIRDGLVEQRGRYIRIARSPRVTKRERTRDSQKKNGSKQDK